MKNSVQKLQYQKLTCVQCGQTYHSPRELAGHIRSQHADTLYEAMDNTERVQGKLRTLCGLIERSSARKPRLLMVEDVHWATPWILDCLAETAAVAG